MVLTDISQLSTECRDWRQILRNYKEEFNDCRNVLLDICNKSLSKEQLAEIEHFENQFHIQLINIHDLKQRIKLHEKHLESESSLAENLTENTYAEHESLLDQFLVLENTLQELRIDFKNFINESSC
jgi:hypothetical protein